MIVVRFYIVKGLSYMRPGKTHPLNLAVCSHKKWEVKVQTIAEHVDLNNNWNNDDLELSVFQIICASLRDFGIANA